MINSLSEQKVSTKKNEDIEKFIDKINKNREKDRVLNLFSKISFLNDELAEFILKEYFNLDKTLLNEFKLSSYLTKIDSEFWVVRDDIKRPFSKLEQIKWSVHKIQLTLKDYQYYFNEFCNKSNNKKIFNYERIAELIKEFMDKQENIKESKALKYMLIYSNILLNIEERAGEITKTFLKSEKITNGSLEIMKIVDYQLEDFIENSPRTNILQAHQEAFLFKAKFLRKIKKFQEAEKYFKYVIDSNIKNEVMGEACQLYGHMLNKEFYKNREAKELVKKSLELLKDNTFLKAKSYSILGNLYKNDFNKAKFYFDNSLKILENINNKEEEIFFNNDKRGKALVLHDIGLLYFKLKNDFNSAKKYFDESLKISKEIYDNEHHQAQVLHDMGKIYSRFKNDFNKAKEYFDESLNILKEINDKKGKAEVLHDIGRLYQRLENDFDKAKEYFDASLKIGKRINNKGHQAEVLHDKGLLYLKFKKDFDSAKKYFDNSLKIGKKINNKRHQAEVLHDIGRLYLNFKNDFENAKKYFDESLEIGKELKDKKHIDIVTSSLNFLKNKKS